MDYYSLNNKNHKVNFKEALFNGLAPDRGLYFPQEIKSLKKSFISNLNDYDKIEISMEVISQFIGNQIDKQSLKKIIEHSIDFEFPLKKIDENISVLELFHGPSMAFKDVGARFTSRCLSHFIRNGYNKKVTVLVATSGDTGAAVASGFHKVEGIDVFILYPKNKISNIQEKQISTFSDNIFPIEVEGTFDDCQKIVKDALIDKDLTSNFNFTTANSINISRWIPQTLYYFFAYSQLPSDLEKFSFSIPSGNYGNLFSSLVSKELGLPIENIISSNNINNPVERYFKSGVYTPMHSKETLSNAMDVGDPSNFKRVNEIFDLDLVKMKGTLHAFSFTDYQTMDTIKYLLKNFNYLCDPHGAISYLGAKKFINNNLGSHCIFLETAHFYKFYDEIKNLIDVDFNIPSQLKSILDKEKKSVTIKDYYNFKEHMNSYL
ncbi:MAG: threonine synthase [Flammeovirgaceae bacterium]|nr:threonine synthase [Flammeovirgaceae bacterium]|tara:strand:- start:2084 stop:3385 length:1302 start_codon:yes stop_codon:yes gene_type:complete